MDAKTAAAVRRMSRRAGVSEGVVVKLFLGALAGRPTEEFNFLATERYSAFASRGAIAPGDLAAGPHTGSKGVSRARPNGHLPKKGNEYLGCNGANQGEQRPVNKARQLQAEG